MTTSLGIQLTPGQRCILDLLQRKLLNTIQAFAKLSLERQEETSGNRDSLELELIRLKEKIRRISARQKRFTLEIINGNGNNTIPKESFFEALGLVTKEALSKLNSKTNERRRRTTANPRFSHEAIQAKRALEPLQKRLEPRVNRDKRESSRKPQRHQQQQQQQNQQQQERQHQANSNHINTNINANNSSTTSNSSKIAGAGLASSCHINTNNNSDDDFTKESNQQTPGNNKSNVSNNNNASTRSTTANTTNNNNSSSNKSTTDRYDRNIMFSGESSDYMIKFVNLQKEIDSKVSQIKDKRESNKRLEMHNELIRRRGLEIISAINSINPNHLTFQEGDNNQLTGADNNQHSQSDQAQQLSATGPIDLWIDMKCDESLDGLD